MTLGDKILMISIVVISIAGMIYVAFLGSGIGQKDVVIKVGTDQVKKISFSMDDKTKRYQFEFGGNIGYVEIKNDAVRMLPMDQRVCPKSLCSKTGWISTGYQSIVCLPNQIIVTIEASADKNIDILSY